MIWSEYIKIRSVVYMSFFIKIEEAVVIKITKIPPINFNEKAVLSTVSFFSLYLIKSLTNILSIPKDDINEKIVTKLKT